MAEASLFSPTTFTGPAAVTGLAWHYTNAHRAKKILTARMLEPHPQHAGAHPLVWASTNHVWEPTACKPLQGVTWTYKGQTVPKCLTFEGMQAFGTKLVRFAVPLTLLPYTFPHACTVAGIKPTLQRLLVQAGQALGAHPDAWRATTEAIPHEAWVSVEVWENVQCHWSLVWTP